MNRNLVRAAVLVAAALALTGCNQAVTSGTAPTSPSSVMGAPAAPGSTPASQASAGAATTAAGSAIDAGTLAGISQDLDSVDSANAKTDADQQNADQAATTSDG